MQNGGRVSKALNLALASIAVVGACAPVDAQTASPAPQPSPVASPASPSPAPLPTQRPGTIRWSGALHSTFVTQGTSGPGTRPREAAGFAAGDPLSPETPYDVFSSAPLVPGNADESALYLHPRYAGRTFDADLILGAGFAGGSVTNASYWGESLFATLNPHLGAQMLPYRIAFPAHAGEDDGSAFVASVLGGSVATKDGNFVLRAGWFDLTQTVPFVFVQPAVTNAPPAIGIATAETLGDGPPALDTWATRAPSLPLHGIDAVAKDGLATFEAADAALPALPGTAARMRTMSVVVDHHEGTRYGAQFIDVSTGGALVPTTVLFGGDPRIDPTAQGPLPTSMIGGQRQRIVGLDAAFHATKTLDALVEVARSTYAADHVAEPGTGRAGGYYHAGLSRTHRRATASVDLYRNEAYYGNALLPYGVPENVWSVAWSWPGQWLKSNYQLIDDFPVNINRQGYRLKYALKGGNSPLDVRVSYANFAQITPITYANALQTGFVDGFFLPQANDAATLGHQHQYALFVGYHPTALDVTLDYAEDTMRRPADHFAPQDTVSYDNPEAVLTFSRHIAKTLVASAGLARYGMRGSFGQGYTNVDFAQRTAFAGLELRESAHASSLLTLRRSGFAAIPTEPGGPPPNFTGTLLVFEQRYSF
ncbi:MAG TPA: hypothetical protein VHT05_14950 [Candidatus Elarobacter sp.]|jgi:hypothetical protein|nr:hypothetical protein [Candidatus Elarobacter sp.]